MLAFIRRVFIGSWLGRILVGLIFLSFAALGVGNFFTGIGSTGAGIVARVAGRSIGDDEFERTYRRGLASAAQNQGIADPTALPFGERRQIAIQSLQQLVFQAVIAQAAQRTGIVVPDQVVRDQIFAEKAFLGPDGKFSRPQFDQRLQAAGFTEDQLVRIFREQSAAMALIEPIRVGGHAPAELVRRAYAYGAERRSLDMIMLPFAAVPVPPAPDEATLRRYYDNNADQFAAPQFRRIKLVLLSPQTIGHALDISEADERHAYDELITRYQVPEKRSVQVLIVPTQPQATQLAALWRGGVGWAQLQATVKAATPVSLDDATRASIPSPDIASLVFQASPGSVAGPSRTDAGWVVLRVSKVTPAQNRGFEQVRDELHDMIGAQRANELMSPRVQKLQDAIAGGGLDAIPADLGAAAAEGTLDAQGLTQSGDPAPLPGSDAVRKAIVAQAFARRKGDVPALTQGPENSWFALAVEDVTPAMPLAFVQAADRVRAAWQRDAVRHADEQQAAALFADAQARPGETVQARPGETAQAPAGNGAQAQRGLAAVAGSRPGFTRDVIVHRGQTDGPVPANLARLAFSLAPGTSTMLETPDGFLVATVTGIEHPDPASDALGYGRARDSLDAAMADDIENSYVSALRDRAKPNINGTAIERLVGTPSGAGADSSGS